MSLYAGEPEILCEHPAISWPEQFHRMFDGVLRKSGKENACGIQSIQKFFPTGIKMDFQILCLWTDRRSIGLGKE